MGPVKAPKPNATQMQSALRHKFNSLAAAEKAHAIAEEESAHR